MGRINYGPHLQDPKGILGDVTLNQEVLRNWTMYPLDLDQVVRVTKPSPSMLNDEASVQIPSFYKGNIPPAPDGTPKDTFLKLPGWFKVRRRLCMTSVRTYATSTTKFGKTCNRCQARENIYPVPSAGKHATGANGGKTCNRCQWRKNVQPLLSAGKCATSTRRGKTCNRC